MSSVGCFSRMDLNVIGCTALSPLDTVTVSPSALASQIIKLTLACIVVEYIRFLADWFERGSVIGL